MPGISFVSDMVEEYGDPNGSAAWFLCDRHDPSAVGYRIVSPDLSARDLTYGELRESSERLASSLAALGVGPGDRVATLMGKSSEYLTSLLAIWRLGAVHVPLFTAFAPPAIALRLTGSAARIVICDASQLGKLLPGPDMPDPLPWRVVTTGAPESGTLAFDALLRDAGAPIAPVAVGGENALIHIYTSGTTGAPKGVVVPMRALAAVRAYARFGLDLHSDDIYWCAADPGWAYGLYYGVLASLATGTPSLLIEGGFSPELTWTVLTRFRVTNFAAAPTIYRALRASRTPVFGSLALRRASSAGEPLSPDVNDWAKEALGVEIHDHYGQTETGMLINNHHHPDLAAPLKRGSMGRALPGWRAAVLHEDRDEELSAGEIGRVAMDLPASPFAWFSGYSGDPDRSAGKFSPDGRWYLTGDLARVDEAGDFYFSSRDDDVILMAGYRIGPTEVEAALNSHPSVMESAAIAVPDEIRGEVLEAFVVLHPSMVRDEAMVSELQQWVKLRYAAHAYPRQVHFVEALPKTPSGKLQRFLLRQRRQISVHA